MKYQNHWISPRPVTICIYEQPCQGAEEEKREFTYDHKYAGNDTFQLLSKVLKTVVTFSISQA